jgi:hypothetical protein
VRSFTTGGGEGRCVMRRRGAAKTLATSDDSRGANVSCGVLGRFGQHDGESGDLAPGAIRSSLKDLSVASHTAASHLVLFADIDRRTLATPGPGWDHLERAVSDHERTRSLRSSVVANDAGSRQYSDLLLEWRRKLL